MNVRKMTIDELELLSFTDIAYNIIKLDKRSTTTVKLFKEICKLLKLSDNQYEEKIADFFTSLTTDKRFVLLNSIDWDLRENHSLSISALDNDDDIDDIEEELDDIIIEEENTKDSDDDLDDIDSDDDDEDLDGLEDLELVDEDSELEE